MITRGVLMTAVAAVALLAPQSVMAQATSPSDTELQMQRQQRRVIVRPSPSDETVERDAQAVAAEVEERQRQEQTLRELQRSGSRRPDLDHDVRSGIQSQRLHDALRRR